MKNSSEGLCFLDIEVLVYNFVVIEGSCIGGIKESVFVGEVGVFLGKIGISIKVFKDF